MSRGKKQYSVEEVFTEIYADSESEESDLSEQFILDKTQIEECSKNEKK